MRRAFPSVRLSVRLLVCLSPNCKNAIFSKTKQFRAMVSINDLQEVVHGLIKEPDIGPIDNRIYNSRLNSPHQLRRRKCTPWAVLFAPLACWTVFYEMWSIHFFHSSGSYATTLFRKAVFRPRRKQPSLHQS